MTKEPENVFLDPHFLQTPKQNTISHNDKLWLPNYAIKLIIGTRGEKTLSHNFKEQ